MGLGPRQTDDLSFWEFGAIWRGWRRANTVDDGPKYPTTAQHQAAVEFAVANAANMARSDPA